METGIHNISEIGRLRRVLHRPDREMVDACIRPTAWKDLAWQHEADYLDALRKRQIWCEGTFTALKWGHNLTCVLRRGLEAAEDHCLLSATALNLKRMIISMG